MIYQTQEEAVDSLVTTKAGDQLRNKAREADARKEESFQRSDTDGFLSQWASGVTAQKYRKEAELADQGNQDVFRVLFPSHDRKASPNNLSSISATLLSLSGRSDLSLSSLPMRSSRDSIL